MMLKGSSTACTRARQYAHRHTQVKGTHDAGRGERDPVVHLASLLTCLPYGAEVTVPINESVTVLIEGVLRHSHERHLQLVTERQRHERRYPDVSTHRKQCSGEQNSQGMNTPKSLFCRPCCESFALKNVNPIKSPARTTTHQHLVMHDPALAPPTHLH